MFFTDQVNITLLVCGCETANR